MFKEGRLIKTKKVWCVVKDGIFYGYDKPTSKSQSFSFPLKGKCHTAQNVGYVQGLNVLCPCRPYETCCIRRSVKKSLILHVVLCMILSEVGVDKNNIIQVDDV